MPKNPGFAMFFGPAPIAVHDHRNMLRQFAQINTLFSRIHELAKVKKSTGLTRLDLWQVFFQLGEEISEHKDDTQPITPVMDLQLIFIFNVGNIRESKDITNVNVN